MHLLPRDDAPALLYSWAMLAEKYSVVMHRLLVLEAACTLAVMAVSLRILPFRTVLKLTGSAEAGASDTKAADRRTDNPVAAAVGLAVRAAAFRLPWKAQCLEQALTGRVLLLWRGVPTVLVFGVAKPADELVAHAWLLASDGAVCGGREASSFNTIAAFHNSTNRHS